MLLGALLCVRALLGPAAVQAEDAAPAAQAQEPASPPGYLEAVAGALNEHEAGNYPEARAHFQRAHALYSNARTLRGLGKVEFELRNYGEAVRYLKEALSSTVKPLDAELRAEAEKLLRRARLYVGEVHIDVDPSYATVSVDGARVASGPKASFSLIVGDHVLEFQAQGRLSERRAISIRGGEQTVLQVVLPTPAVERVALAPAPPPLSNHHDDRRPLRKQWWLWTAVGVVAAGAAVGIALAARPDEQRQAVWGGTSNTVLVNR